MFVQPEEKSRRPASGFSLVEILVGMAIGLLGVLVISQVAGIFEGYKRTSTTGSDAQTNGVVAVSAIERDVRVAGYGFNFEGALGCTVKRYFGSAPTTDLALRPVTITNGASGLPDTIQVVASSKGSWSIPSRITTDHPATATNIFLNTTLGMEVGDLLIIYEAGKNCTLIQATGIPNGNVQVHHQNTSQWNPPGGSNIFPTGGYGVGATLFNLGAMIDHTYSLDANSNFLLSAVSTTTNTSTVQTLAADVVNLQAQYGFDRRAGTLTDSRVDIWSDTLIDADGNGTVGDSNDIMRMPAIRFALVARSGLKEKKNAATGLCDVTASAPTWTAGTIDVSKNPDGTSNADWKCYRYKTFESVVPLRNIIWKETP